MNRPSLHGEAADRSSVSYRRLLYTESGKLSVITVHEPSGRVKRLREEVIHDIWHRQEFETSRFVTTQGARVVVLDPGTPNTDGGPDFRHANIEIDGLHWFGDIEIHRTPAGWYDHEHDRDPRYNRVILHVSMYADESSRRLRREDRTYIPEVVLHPYLTRPLRQLLYQFYNRPDDEIYCRGSWNEVPPEIRLGWIRRLGLERLHAHKDKLAEAYLRKGDLHAVLYRHLFRALGYAKNAEAMFGLADRVPLDAAQTCAERPSALEGLYLGMAGLLSGGHTRGAFDRESTRYIERLRRSFHTVKDCLDRPPMAPTAWQFFRLRPANFPTLRIAQGAALLRKGELLHGDALGRLIEAVDSKTPVARLRSLLQVGLPEFWNDHVRLERRSKPRNPTLGVSRADTIAVNVLLPVLLLYAEQQENIVLLDRVEDVFERFPPDHDRMVRRFKKLGAAPSNARETQGIHQLYRTRCARGRCLQCAIGRYILEHR